MIVTILKNANLALAFLLELGVLAALIFWGFSVGATLPVAIILGIGAPLIATVIWALWGAPASAHHLNGVRYWLLRVAFDVVGILALATAGQQLLSLLFAVLALINCSAGYSWKQQPMVKEDLSTVSH